MSKFPEWGQVSQDPLELPINGTVYTIPPLGYLDEIRIKEAQQAAQAAMNGDTAPDGVEPLTDEQFNRMILGDALDKMRADNVPSIAIIHAAAVAHTDATLGREQALYVWERGLDPKALETDMAAVKAAMDQAVQPNRKTRRAAKKAPAKKAAKKQPRSTRSPNTGAGS